MLYDMKLQKDGEEWTEKDVGQESICGTIKLLSKHFPGRTEENHRTISQDICSAINSTKIQNRHLFNIVSTISTWTILWGEILIQGYRCLATLCEQKGINTAKSCSSLQHKYGGMKKGERCYGRN